MRILTEDKNINMVIDCVSEEFANFTWYRANGVWNGKTEPSLIIEIEIPAWLEGTVLDVAEEIKIINEQECVLVQTIENNAKFI